MPLVLNFQPTVHNKKLTATELDFPERAKETEGSII